MPTFLSLFRPKLLVLSAAMLLAEDKPTAHQQRPEPRTQQPASRTTTRNLASIPTFSAAKGTKSPSLRKKHKFAQNTDATTSTQPSPLLDTNSETESSQRKTDPKTAAAKENRQPTNLQTADGKNLPRNPTTTRSPASAKTAPQLQDHAVLRQGQSLMNALCASCHSTMLVNNARKTSGDWRKTLSKMENQGMPKLPPALREPLIQYLATALGIPIGNLRPNYSPWADRRNTNPLW